MSKNFSCVCCGTSSLNINVKIPVKGFVPGQSIPITLNIDNKSGVNVRHVNIKLEKVSLNYF